jgi:hypothetical protein
LSTHGCVGMCLDMFSIAWWYWGDVVRWDVSAGWVGRGFGGVAAVELSRSEGLNRTRRDGRILKIRTGRAEYGADATREDAIG